jgi:hypothetical protein
MVKVFDILSQVFSFEAGLDCELARKTRGSKK